MSAITGRYAAARAQYNFWSMDWLQLHDRWTTPRYHLATQLRKIRQLDGNHEAREFRSYLLWLGVYPVRRTTSPKGE